MADFTIEPATIESLTAKLDAFSGLTDDERAALVAIFALANASIDAGGETSGFAAPVPMKLTGPAGPSLPSLNTAFKGSFTPGFTRPGGTVMDSVGVNLEVVQWTKDY